MKSRHLVLSVLLSLVLLSLPVLVLAQTGTSYDLTWYTMDGGGATLSNGGDYTLGGTIGQPDAGVLVGGDYILYGGFWPGAATGYRIYLPLVLRKH